MEEKDEEPFFLVQETPTPHSKNTGYIFTEYSFEIIYSPFRMDNHTEK